MEFKKTIKRVLCAAVCVIMLLGCMACSSGLSHSTLNGTWEVVEGVEITFSNENFRIDYPNDPNADPIIGSCEIKDDSIILNAKGTEKIYSDVKISGDELKCFDEFVENEMTWRKK